MRIISNFHDYYDPVQAQGQDQECVWVREPYTYRFLGDVPSLKYYNSKSASPYIIGFCGKIYPMLIVHSNDISQKAYCYSLEEVDEFIEDIYKPKQIAHYRNEGKLKYKNSINLKRYSIKKYFQECEEIQIKYESIFIDNNCPVFIIEPSGTHNKWNEIVFHGIKDRENAVIPNMTQIKKHSFKWRSIITLEDLKFYQQVDVYQSFQEIYMYLSGVLGHSNPHVPDMDDKTKRDIHGFDNMSFKKESTKRN